MIFFTDIDNTLIFSEKRAAKESICVEYKDNQPITFMTKKSIELYKTLCEKITVVPVTTRSTEQFIRIENIRDSKYAITANGAKLLINGKEDKEWTEYFSSYIGKFKEVFKKCSDILETNFPKCRIRMADGIFLYSRLDEHTDNAVKMLSEICINDDVNINASHGKIYIIPKEIGKANAVKRFCRKYNIAEKTVSAGDSLMDIDMLLSTDIGIAMCGELKEKLKNLKDIIFAPSFNDTEFVLSTVLLMSEKR